ncbi:MAG: aldo/keto reductase [Spirochaetales bacterium]|nr:aldo/keto reductase [Leptospiraceae bacterium]MCP5482090.1 aldo/keto reductase [Spirochaetales bacterium]MCP5484954.1 aldo/keto reductase [Spirochaetales bacterium]
MQRTAKIGLGLAALGRPGYINLGHAIDLAGRHEPVALEKHTHGLLDAAFESGVRYFDAARSYGRAEEFLGSWLGSRKPKDVRVASKWGYVYTADWNAQAEKHEIKDHSLPNLKRQWAETENFLGDWLNLYQIHSAVPETGVLSDARVLGELARLKSKGVDIGLSVSGPNQSETIKQAIDTVVDGGRLFDAVQATFNLLEQSAGPALEDAHRSGLQVIIKEGLANGRLTDRNSLAEDHDRLQRLRQHCAKRAVALDSFSLAYPLTRPWVDIVLSGAAALSHLKSNLLASEYCFEAEDENLAVGLGHSPEQYWRLRSRLPWQ